MTPSGAVGPGAQIVLQFGSGLLHDVEIDGELGTPFGEFSEVSANPAADQFRLLDFEGRTLDVE